MERESRDSYSDRKPKSSLKAVLEWFGDDPEQQPTVFPAAGTDELDRRVCDAIRKRWQP